MLSRTPTILWLTPKSIEGIFENLMELGDATDRRETAANVINFCRKRLDRLREVLSTVQRRPRVFCMEWVDPIYCCGHWVPEMIDIAAGTDVLGRKGADSVRIDWREVVHADPEVLIVMPCGFKLAAAAEQAGKLETYEGFSQLTAVQENRVYAVDANSYFARPGPRVVDGTELLAHLLHPGLVDWHGPADAYRQIGF